MPDEERDIDPAVDSSTDEEVDLEGKELDDDDDDDDSSDLGSDE